jgi:hypothetical protein
MSSCLYIATFWTKNTKIVELYFFDSDMEAQVNKRCCIMEGLEKENVATIRNWSELIRRNVSASWWI